jgi:RNA ligase (TIGR02306 family)
MQIKIYDGLDLTDILGITKWEPPIPASLRGEVFGMLPGQFKKTDQERIQNLWKEVNREIDYEVSLKLDGTSCQMGWLDNNFVVCSRNLNLKPNENVVFWKMAYKYNMQEKMTKLNRNLSFQGEVIGEGIQGNNEKIKGQDFYVFNVWDIDRQEFLGVQERQDLIAQLELKSVPVLEIRKFNFPTIEEALAYSVGPSLNPQANREGVVFKSLDGAFSFKIISDDYVLKNPDR